MLKGQNAPRKKTVGLRSKAWWVLRKNKSITLSEIMLTVCTGKEKNAETNLRSWLSRLVEVGLLSREREQDGKLTSNGTYRYQLLNDIGVESPVVRKQGVYDPNSKSMIVIEVET